MIFFPLILTVCTYLAFGYLTNSASSDMPISACTNLQLNLMHGGQKSDFLNPLVLAYLDTVISVSDKQY